MAERKERKGGVKAPATDDTIASADWSDRDVFDYLTRHDLPYHPLWEQGYPSIGDWHTTRRLSDVADPEATRFFGLKRECGLHEIDASGI